MKSNQSTSTTDDETPPPGIRVEPQEEKKILQRFLKKYRVDRPSVASNLPTPSTLKGKSINGLNCLPEFSRLKRVSLLLEYPRELFDTTPSAVVDFLDSKNPWEDYDMCIFDGEMNWCIGITHDSDVILCDNFGFFP